MAWPVPAMPGYAMARAADIRKARTMTLPARRNTELRTAPGWAWSWTGEPHPFYLSMRDAAAEAAGTWGAADLEESKDAYLLEMDLPGVSKEAITVDVTRQEIRISGEVKEHEHTGLLHHQGRREGRFDQVVNLPGEVDPSRAEAALADGVLTVRAPKPEEGKPRKVEVMSG